jgi:hypothetical protein
LKTSTELALVPQSACCLGNGRKQVRRENAWMGWGEVQEDVQDISHTRHIALVNMRGRHFLSGARNEIETRSKRQAVTIRRSVRPRVKPRRQQSLCSTIASSHEKSGSLQWGLALGSRSEAQRRYECSSWFSADVAVIPGGTTYAPSHYTVNIQIEHLWEPRFSSSSPTTRRRYAKDHAILVV